ncbi:tetratricopeptide repeat protein [Fulvivirga sediminis]|uniref:Tetratricopeptide repeat protein n=1 Tax=Fulvivirga sediminis TaxID=2803949 RepID=A0A937JWZ6_9BACT|nr:tetratricopeptide repeat protein [Fulvivirga sediminis]MBL3654998.1 tetratricopeptide repeat protein [Fulvivirga sediminis]
MADKKTNNTTEHHNELLENPEALADQLTKTEEFLEKNKTIVLAIIAIFVVGVAGYFGFKYYKNSQNDKAQNEMFQAVYYFESDSLDLALNGDGNRLGFLDIIDEYGITEAANLAHYYVGAAYLKQGNFDDAISHLEEFSAGDLLVQARAYSLIGDAYMEKGEFESAASYFQKAADYKPNKYFTPEYLMKAALAYEKLNQVDEAKESYDKIINNYWDSNLIQTAKKYKARLGA